MVKEARLESVASGLAPVTPGWFVVNTAEAAWVTNQEWSGGICIFESDDFVLRGRPDLTEYEKPHAGFTIRVVPPGHPAALYHAESVQEDFLILQGECTLIETPEEGSLEDHRHAPPVLAPADNCRSLSSSLDPTPIPGERSIDPLARDRLRACVDARPRASRSR